ncbi:MAG TPA: ribosome small subunit-dependent GTPase A [Bryobacteraceae bacterium]|nr:ribosome small subunit-dependent GTPase A [Bryobacteraceae bacterium]
MKIFEMSREDRKLRKHFEERAKRELRLAKKFRSKFGGEPRSRSRASSAGMAVETGPGFCDVLSGGQRVRCRSAGDATIGDRVLFSVDRRRIEEVLPRRTTLSRADPQNPHRERVIAANIDLVVHVVSLKSPPLRPGLIDRYLIATAAAGAAPLVCVNKIDLLEAASELEPLQTYEALGVPVLRCSAASGQGIHQLREALAAKLCVFTGHSGVGKSSLLNALDPDLELATNTVNAASEKGRHTTTSSALYQLANGGMVIDTPGIREFGLWKIRAADVRRYFHEFSSHQCAFSDCSHIHEPDCAVRAAADSGAIAPARYESYRRIVATLDTGPS